MADTRFFAPNGPFSGEELAQKAGLKTNIDQLARDISQNIFLANCASLDVAGPHDLAYCDVLPKGFSPEKNSRLDTKAGAVLISEANVWALPENCLAIIAKRPRSQFGQLVDILLSERRHAGAALISPDAHIEDGVEIGPNVMIGQGASIGSGTKIGANAIIAPGVQIGRNCNIGATVHIQSALIGDRVRIKPQTVIGGAGFGVAAGPTGPVDVPQLGRVIVQDDVGLGSFVAIDRGAFTDTVIGLGTKIDNHCHIAHNVVVGQGVVMAAFAGIAGTVTIGDFVMMGGRVGVADHVNIGKGAQIGASAVLLRDVAEGAVMVGYPASEQRQWAKEVAAIKRLTKRK